MWILRVLRIDSHRARLNSCRVLAMCSLWKARVESCVHLLASLPFIIANLPLARELRRVGYGLIRDSHDELLQVHFVRVLLLRRMQVEKQQQETSDPLSGLETPCDHKLTKPVCVFLLHQFHEQCCRRTCFRLFRVRQLYEPQRRVCKRTAPMVRFSEEPRNRNYLLSDFRIRSPEIPNHIHAF